MHIAIRGLMHERPPALPPLASQTMLRKQVERLKTASGGFGIARPGGQDWANSSATLRPLGPLIWLWQRPVALR